MRDELIKIAKETVAISKLRKYSIKGKEIKLDVNFSSKLYHQIPELNKKGKKEGEISFINDAVMSVVCNELKDLNNVTILNFASAKHAGGGFLTGSNAQEESIARCSNMYLSLKKFQKDFYNKNKEENNPLYTDDIIFSRNISVFRNSSLDFLNSPIIINIITSPAVNAGVARERKISEQVIEQTMQNRIRKIIEVAALERTDYLVLGAFGCGVFKNDDKKVAQMFKKVLEKEGMKYHFKKVIFAIYDTPSKYDRFIRYYSDWRWLYGRITNVIL